MDTPLLSIIVPVYNTEKYLQECFNSLRNQKYKNIEVLFVDDCSTDGSYEVCRNLCALDARFQTLRMEINGGLSRACTFALSHSKGELISFIDSDDYVEPTMFCTLYDMMVENGSDISCCIMNYIFEDGRPSMPACRVSDTVECVDTRKALGMLHRRDGISYSRCDKIYRRNIVESVPMHDGVFEDMAIMFRYVAQARKVTLIRKPFYQYRQRLGSILHCGYKVRAEYDAFVLYCNETEYLEKEWGFEDLNTIVRKGAHFLNHISLLPQTEEIKELRTKVVERMREYDSLSVRSLGLGLYLKRYLLLHYYTLYRSGYKIFMKIFKKNKYNRITGKIIRL
ncbi:MAG: glycosyltransferase [Clostridium sp.]|nr:glycosyltransferase [Clostridium sp.]